MSDLSDIKEKTCSVKNRSYFNLIVNLPKANYPKRFQRKHIACEAHIERKAYIENPERDLYRCAYGALNTKAGLDGVEDLVGDGTVLGHHAQSLGVHLLGDGTVLQGLGVDEDVQGSGLQGGLAADGTAAGVGDGQTAALVGEDLDVADGLAAQLHDLHGGGAGDDGGLLHDGVTVGVILGDAVGLGQGQEVDFVSFNLVQKLGLQIFCFIGQRAERKQITSLIK